MSPKEQFRLWDCLVNSPGRHPGDVWVAGHQPPSQVEGSYSPTEVSRSSILRGRFTARLLFDYDWSAKKANILYVALHSHTNGAIIVLNCNRYQKGFGFFRRFKWTNNTGDWRVTLSNHRPCGRFLNQCIICFSKYNRKWKEINTMFYQYSFTKPKWKNG